MAERELCDLTHQVQQTLDIGKLKAIARYPVLAGDSFEFNSSILYRLNQLRRPLALDVKADVFVFFCPYRYAYPEWVQYIEQGYNEAVTFSTYTTTDFGPSFLLTGKRTFPKHLWHDTCNIWNNYFRDPSWSEMDGNSSPALLSNWSIIS